MKRLLCWLIASIALCGLFAAGAVQAAAAGREVTSVRTGDYVVTGPYTFKNLSVFFISGKDKLKGTTFVTLAEALDQKIAIVSETGEVNELTVENKSPTVHVYIQSGVIVKGGKQDRTIQYDIILPPRSGKVPVSSFCVEAHRWTRRGAERVESFGSAGKNLSTKELKLAAKRSGDQQEVWNNIAKAQESISSNLNSDVKSKDSASSLQLTLENDTLEKAAGEYAAALGGVAAQHKDVVGYAFAINGEINSADVYASKALFDKLWPSLLNACAVEAIAKQQKDRFTEPSPEVVKVLIEDAEKGKSQEKNLTRDGKAKMMLRESRDSVMFESLDRSIGEPSIRSEYIKK